MIKATTVICILYLVSLSVCVFQNEMMTGTYTQNPVISRVTLALMEDTGFVPLHN